jgi:hypothetical protein
MKATLITTCAAVAMFLPSLALSQSNSPTFSPTRPTDNEWIVRSPLNDGLNLTPQQLDLIKTINHKALLAAQDARKGTPRGNAATGSVRLRLNAIWAQREADVRAVLTPAQLVTLEQNLRRVRDLHSPR